MVEANDHKQLKLIEVDSVNRWVFHSINLVVVEEGEEAIEVALEATEVEAEETLVIDQRKLMTLSLEVKSFSNQITIRCRSLTKVSSICLRLILDQVLINLSSVKKLWTIVRKPLIR